MKKVNLLIVAIVTLIVIACEKTNELPVNSIEGTYFGTVTIESRSKSNAEVWNAKAVVTRLNNEQAEIHCFGSEFDTTFMLNYFEHNDSVMVCLTGDEFEHIYGHSYGGNHMIGGMMDDMQDGETEWMHHMNDEHIESDEHFGGFDMMQHSFGYTFKMNDLDFHFQGVK